MNKTITFALTLFFTLLLAAPVCAQTPSILDHYTLTFGSYFTSQDTTLRVDGSGGEPGTPIDFETTTGLDSSSTLARGSFDWMVGRKHQVSFGVYRTSRRNEKAIDTEIEFDGQIYPIDTVVKSKLTTSFYDAAYTYYPYLRENRAFGITGSLVVMTLSARLTSEPQSGSSTSIIDGRASTGLPAPGIGISYRHRFAGNWQFDTRASFLPKLTIDKYNAKTSDVIASLEYRFKDHYSAGVAYNYFGFTVGVDAAKADFNGELKYTIQGPQANFRFYW